MIFIVKSKYSAWYLSFFWWKRSPGLVPKQKSQKHQDWEIPKDLPLSPGRQRGCSDPIWTYDLCVSHLSQHVQARANPQQWGRATDVPRLDPDLQQPRGISAIFLGSAPTGPAGLLKAFRVASLGGRAAAAAAAAAPGAPADQFPPRFVPSAQQPAAPPLILQPLLPELQKLQSSTWASSGRARRRHSRWGSHLRGPGGPLPPSADVLGGNSGSRTPPRTGGPTDLHGLHLRPDLQRCHRHKLPGILKSWQKVKVINVFTVIILILLFRRL